jgi:replicative DNA helicase
MGKTAFILSMAKNMAVDHNIGVAFFSLEMSSIQLVNRMIVSASKLDHKKIKNGRLEDWEWVQLEEKIEGLTNAPIYIDDTPALSIFELRAKIRRLKSQYKIDIIMIDYLQLMRGSDKSGNREQEVSTISRSLKAMAKEFNVPVITLSQLNRSVESRGGDKKPQLSDLRESGAIEQDADMVLFIHRPEYYGLTETAEGESTAGLAELIIAKHRNGETGTVKLKFKKEYTEFSDWDSFVLDDDFVPKIVESKINKKDDDGLNPNIDDFNLNVSDNDPGF